MATKETWVDALGAKYEVDRELRVACPCGKTAVATLLRVTVPPDPPLRTRWFRPPAHWFVSVANDPKTEDGKVIEGPFVRCPHCIRLVP